MKRMLILFLLVLSGFSGWTFLLAQAEYQPANQTYDPGIEPRHRRNVIQLSPVPPLYPDSQPVSSYPGASSPASVDNPNNAWDYVRFEPYNLYPRELDLWNLEGRRFIRSNPVLTPDKAQYAYTEIMFIPATRQTLTRLYLVQTPPPPRQFEHLPSEDALYPAPDPDPVQSYDSYNPDKTLKSRQALVSIGYDKVKQFEFRMLTLVDWSASGSRLLVKQRSGVLHVGLRTSDILIYDQGRGTVSIYPEIHRAIQYYWENNGNLPHIGQISWDIQPLGWEPGSDSAVLLKAWAYDRSAKKYLGLWRYDFDAERTQLLTMEPYAAPQVAANGWLAKPVPVPPQPAQSGSGWKRMFGYSEKTKYTGYSGSVHGSAGSVGVSGSMNGSGSVGVSGRLRGPSGTGSAGMNASSGSSRISVDGRVQSGEQSGYSYESGSGDMSSGNGGGWSSDASRSSADSSESGSMSGEDTSGDANNGDSSPDSGSGASGSSSGW